MEGKKELQLGSFGHDVLDEVNGIVTQVLEKADTIVSAECDIPEGYVRIPDKFPEKEMRLRESTDRTDKVKMALSAVLPAGLTALASAFNAPAAVVVILSGAGGVAGSFIQNTADVHSMRMSDLDLQELNLDQLTVSDIRVRTVVDEQKKQDLKDAAQGKIDLLCSEIVEYETKMNDRHDIAVDKTFGEWVQGFLMYADSRPDDRRLQLMRDELINRLARMKIHVYDEIVLDKDGRPNVPIQDYLIDSREGEGYEKLLKPAVYSDRSLLARGEIA